MYIGLLVDTFGFIMCLYRILWLFWAFVSYVCNEIITQQTIFEVFLWSYDCSKSEFETKFFSVIAVRRSVPLLS